MLDVRVGVRGEYRMRALKPDGEAVRDSGWMPNLITNYGMDLLGSSSSNVNTYCSVGEGNTVPAFTDTALVTYHQSQGAQFSDSESNGGSPDYENRLNKIWRFPTQVVNKNYAEVGVGVGTIGNNLFSRALIVDGGGSPTTFTVLIGEQLEVTYRLWVYPKVSDSSASVTISGTSYTFTYRGRSVASTGNLDAQYFGFGWSNAYTFLNGYNGTISVNTGSGPSGSSSVADSHSVQAYTSGNYYRDVICTFSTVAGNVAGGISAMEAYFRTPSGGSLLPIQIGVSPTFAKDNTKTLSLTIRFSWARI